MESLEQAYRQAADQAWNHGEAAALDALFGAGYVGHDPTMHRDPGPEGEKKFVRLFREAFPDLRFTVEDAAAGGDRLAVRFTLSGRHTGDLLGIAPTRREVTITGLALYRVEAGKIVEGWTQWDALGLFRQLGGGMAP